MSRARVVCGSSPPPVKFWSGCEPVRAREADRGRTKADRPNEAGLSGPMPPGTGRRRPQRGVARSPPHLDVLRPQMLKREKMCVYVHVYVQVYVYVYVYINMYKYM